MRTLKYRKPPYSLMECENTTTDISNELTRYAGKEGEMYQITVKAGATGNNQFSSWLCVTEAELNKIVQDYIAFKLTGKVN
jgi:predicted RecB family endonuclease